MKSSDLKKGQWLYEVLKIVENIPQTTFSLEDIYEYENDLKKKFPRNNFVRDKIRQQLQHLRDLHVLEFIDYNGKYKKI